MTAYDLSLAKDGLILLFLTDLTDFPSLEGGDRGEAEYPIDGQDLCESFSPSLEERPRVGKHRLGMRG